MTQALSNLVDKNNNTGQHRISLIMSFRPQYTYPGLTSLILLCLVTVAAMPGARAQVLERHDTVTERARPGLDADGMPIGAMRLYPAVGVRLNYSDNVFADDSMKASDTALHVLPELRLRSRSPRHRAELGTSMDIARYSDLRTEDYDDLRLWALGDMQVRNGKLEARLRFDDIHENRTSPDDARGTELTGLKRSSVTVAYTYQPGRLLLRADGVYRMQNFGNTQTTGGIVNNDDRDRDQLGFGLRAGYSMSPDYILFVETRTDSIDYDQRLDRNGFARSSDGIEARVGTLLDFSGRTSGEFFVGYLRRGYDDGRFNDVTGLSFGGEVAWNPTRLTTVTIAGSRTVRGTTIVGASGIFRSALSVGLDHELRRNLILATRFQYWKDDFQDIDRNDDLAFLDLGAKYLMSRYARLELGYRYQTRDTSPTGSGGRNYKINDVFLQIVGQL